MNSIRITIESVDESGSVLDKLGGLYSGINDPEAAIEAYSEVAKQAIEIMVRGGDV